MMCTTDLLLRFQDKEVVPVLELDVHGPDPVTFGVHRGDIVFISSSPTGLALPSLGRIGESEEFPEDTELRQIIGDLGMSYARQHPKESPLILPRAGREAPEIDWYGSVVDLHLDGTIEIALPCGRKVGESIDRLTLLVDGFDDQQWGDEEYDTEEEEEEGWMTEDGGEAGEKDDWEDLPDGEGDGSDMVDGLDEDGDVEMQSPNLDQAGTAQIASSKPDGIQPEPSAPESSAASSNPTRCPSPSHQALPNAPGANMPQDDSRWSRFEVLEEAPRDHAFINEPQTPPKKAFFSRLQKEFRVLQSSLPGE